MAAVRAPTRVRETESVSPLFEACKTGDIAAVKQLATRENVNSRDATVRKSTPLHFAAGTEYSSQRLWFVPFTESLIMNSVS